MPSRLGDISFDICIRIAFSSPLVGIFTLFFLCAGVTLAIVYLSNFARACCVTFELPYV